MKSFLGFILGIALICGSAAAKSGSESKYQRLQKMMVNNQVTLNDDTYTEFLLRGDRDFDAFVLYTTIGNRYQCRLCPTTNAEFARVANAYAALEEKPDRNVVFIRVPIDIAPKVFSFHSIVSAPSISFLSSTEVLGKKLNADNDFQLEYPVRAENIASFLRSKIHVQIEIKRFPWPQVIILSLFVFGLPLCAYVYLFLNDKVYAWLGHTKLFVFLSLLVYGVAVTGIVYDIINDPPLFNCDQRGCSIFATQGQNQQTLAEGLVTGAMLVGCAWSAIRLLGGVGKSESGEKEINKYIIVFGICFTLYFLCFCVRTPWYPTVFSYWG
ncbi:hypothetical protein AV274_6424 [Blastocystis sp. ATCC 50177/Nand II]|uniref:Uncharacterized protein n=1 Tax=Blastocystis sp. subtype 1 (strain ATCC 50177 / NandII) TaxID=478820 RepID=A0A196S7F7_BLAHN|nr:hypothetical protein AV274_6424 [Blastocystis sp. ATCC 50177/Nand II]